MKKVTLSGIFLALLFCASMQPAFAQSNKAVDMFKNHINKVIQKVKKEENPQEKRTLLNNSFDNMLSTFNKVEHMKTLSQNDQVALNELESNITAKKNELNGTNGYKRVPNGQLNHFASYVQQNVEQASSTITISVTVLILIIILIVLLA